MKHSEVVKNEAVEIAQSCWFGRRCSHRADLRCLFVVSLIGASGGKHAAHYGDQENRW